MTKHMRLLASASVLAVAALGAAPAFATGTTAGTDITNSVNVNYQVGGVSQTAVPSNVDSFKVDRKVIMTMTEPGNATTSVGPGQIGAVTTFVLTNSSNDVLDFVLSAVQPVGGSAPHGGNDNFDATALAIWVDTNGNNTLDGADTQVAYVNDLGADTSRTIFVVSNIPVARASGDKAVVTLSATAYNSSGTSGSPVALTNDSGNANVAGTVQNVFADGIGATDGDKDGVISARDDYTVLGAALSANKTSTIISDPITGTAGPGVFPKMIPGAVVEYCIAVSNAAGSATATNIVITDTLPSQTTYVTNSIIVDGDASCANGSAGGSQAAGVVTAPLSSIAAGTTRSARFRATVN